MVAKILHCGQTCPSVRMGHDIPKCIQAYLALQQRLLPMTSSFVSTHYGQDQLNTLSK